MSVKARITTIRTMLLFSIVVSRFSLTKIGKGDATPLRQMLQRQSQGSLEHSWRKIMHSIDE
jgi:hypothetical protein